MASKIDFAQVVDDELKGGAGADFWLRVAIRRLGGPAHAARRMHVKTAEVRAWLQTGVRDLPYWKVERLARLGRVAVEPLGWAGSNTRSSASGFPSPSSPRQGGSAGAL